MNPDKKINLKFPWSTERFIDKHSSIMPDSSNARLYQKKFFEK